MSGPKAPSSMRDLLLAVVVLAALGGGVALVAMFPDEIAGAYRKVFPENQTPAAPPAASRAPAPAAAPESGPAPQKHTPAAASTPASGSGAAAPSSSDALNALELAVAKYRRMDYAGALAALAAIRTGSLAGADAAEFTRLKERCEVFKEVTAGIEPLELASGEGIVEVVLSNGNKLEGRIMKQKDGFVTLQKNHGIKGILRSEEVDKIVPIPRDEMKRRRDGEFAKIAGDLSNVTSARLFELAEHCIREGLPDKVTGLLEKASEKDALFRETVYNEKAKRVYKLYLWYKGKKKDKNAAKVLSELMERFGHSFYVAKAQEDEKAAEGPSSGPSKPGPGAGEPAPAPPGGEGERPAPEPDPFAEDEPEPEPARSPLEGTNYLEDAERALKTARRHEEKAEPGKPGADQENRKAIEYFEKALDLYEKAQKQFPERAEELDDVLTDIQQSLFWCKKRQTLG